MPATLSHRDLLLCVIARQREMADDACLERVVARWLAHPERPLIDLLAAQAHLSPAQVAKLRAAVDQQATETCVDPLAAHLRQLPTGVQRLLGSAASDVALATQQGMDTMRDDSRRPAGRHAATEKLPAGDRFDIQQVHAQGGLGVVFLARDQEIDRTVALKQIKSQWADDADSRTRFLLEARITGRLEHPGIVPIYAIGADATGRPYYAMRLIRGESLLEVIERFHDDRVKKVDAHERMSELRKLLKRFIDVCNAVNYAHSKGVIHRDVKPSNIMVGKYGETLVVDWGLAKVIGSDEDIALTTRMIRSPESDVAATHTRLGTTIGTPAYMSPEQAAGRNDELGPATDVYSLGATLYHMLTGWLPHVNDDDVGVMMARIGSNTIVPPRARADWLPRPLASICLKALAPLPQDRYVSARALSDDVERWLGDEPVRAHADSWTDRAFRWMRNHRELATALAVGYVFIAAAIVAGVILWNYIDTHK